MTSTKVIFFFVFFWTKLKKKKKKTGKGITPKQKVCVYVLSHSVMSNSETPWTGAHQAPLPMGFSRQEYWSGLLFPLPGDGIFPTQGSNLPLLCLLHCKQILYSLSRWGSLSWKYLKYEFSLHVFFKTKGWKWTNGVFLLLKPNSQVGSRLFCMTLCKERKRPPEWLPFLNACFTGWPDPRTQRGVSGRGRKSGEEEVEGKK